MDLVLTRGMSHRVAKTRPLIHRLFSFLLSLYLAQIPHISLPPPPKPQMEKEKLISGRENAEEREILEKL